MNRPINIVRLGDYNVRANEDVWFVIKGLDVTINKQQILSGDAAAFTTVLTTCYTDAAQAATQNIGQLSEVNCLKAAEYLATHHPVIRFDEQGDEALLQNITAECNSLSLADTAYIKFCYHLLVPYTRLLQLDAALIGGQESIQRAVFIQSLADTDFWIKPHPLKNLTDYLYLSMLGWQPGFGQYSDQLKSLYDQAVADISAVKLADKKAFSAIEQQLRQQIADFQSQVDRIAQRMKEAESGKIKNRVSQLEAYSFVSNLTHGRVLPPPVVEFIHTQLVMDLHMMLINQGLDSRIWQQLKQLLQQLVAMYQPGANLDSSHKQLPLLLQTFIEEYLQRTELSDQFVNTIAFDISQLSIGKPAEGCSRVEPLRVPDHLHGIERQVSQQLLNHSRQFKEQQWFLMRDAKGATQRCKLLFKLEQYDQLLFSNFVGQRVVATNQGDFAYLLSARHMQPLSMYGGLTRCLHNLLDQLLEGFEERFNKHLQAIENIKQERINLAREAERKAAAEKARHEAELIAKQKAAAEQQAQLEQATADLKRHARLSLDSLTLGAWVEFLAPDGSYKRAKLAVKFNATGRFVFVDENGITVADAQRDELVAQILDGSMKHLESDKKFAERLARIVTDIRTAQ